MRGIVECKRRTLLSVRRALFGVHTGYIWVHIHIYIHTYIYNSVYVGLFSVNTKGSDGCTSKAPVSVVGLFWV